MINGEVMIANSIARPVDTRKDEILAFTLKVVLAVALVLLVAVIAQASNGGAGNALQEFNTWLESEIGGSIGTAIGLVSFLLGLITSIAMQRFMPVLWGIFIGLILGVGLTVVTNATSYGMPVLGATVGG
jgi:hypothetical protein